MKQWEYCTLSWVARNGDLLPHNIQDMGRKGWEAWFQEIFDEDHRTIYFKREIPPQPSTDPMIAP